MDQVFGFSEFFAVDTVWEASDWLHRPEGRLPLQPAATIRLRWCYGEQAGRGSQVINHREPKERKKEDGRFGLNL